MRTQQEETVKHTPRHIHTETQGDTKSVAFSFRNGKLLRGGVEQLHSAPGQLQSIVFNIKATQHSLSK